MIVLWVLAFLTVMVVAFSRRAMLEHRAAAFALDRTQAIYMARGAATRGIVEIRNKAAADRRQNRGGYTGMDQRWANPPDLLSDDALYTLGGPVETENEEAMYIIKDAERALSINSAPPDLLKNLPGMNLRVVREIITRRTNSTEKNESHAFLALEEVQALPGIEDEVWYGTDEEPGLRDMLSVYGSGKININTCSYEVLKTVPGLHDQTIELISGHLAGGDGIKGTEDDVSFISLHEIEEVLGLSADQLTPLDEYCKVDSQFFTITAFATQRQGKVRAQVTATIANRGNRTEMLAWREDTFGL
jgi:type II secretory pathway component PulK